MNEEQIKDKITEYIQAEFLTPEESAGFTPITPMVSSRLLDSISTLQLVDFIEKTFNIEFSHHEVDEDNLDTIERICAFIKSKK